MKTRTTSTRVSQRRRAGLAALVGLALATFSVGCVSMKALVYPDKPVPPVSQIAATWENKVFYAPDPAHGGAPSPGLAGRLYLFGEETGHPLVGDGSVLVDLFDDMAVASGGQPRLIEKWILDKDTVKRLLRKDMIGQGYTLFLPWGTFKPETTQVHLMVTYTPQKGNPLYSPSSTITLNKEDAGVHGYSSRTVVPAAGEPTNVASAANGPTNVAGAASGQPAQWHTRFVVPDPAKRESAE
jgi:hypothetical protein